MGQHHIVVNLDKRQYLKPTQLGDGLKLLEFGDGGATLTALGEDFGSWPARRLSAFHYEGLLDLAEMSRKAGNLKEAEAELQQGLAASRQAGDTHYLPDTLTALAALQTEMGNTQDAYASYERAEDVIDGMLLHAPSAYSESALLSEMSDSYLGEFRLAAQERGTGKAFQIIERARGRAIVDELKSHPTTPPPQPSTADRLTEDQIAQLQTRLMGSYDPNERSRLLDELAEAEERLQYVQSTLNPEQRRATTEPVELGKAQRTLLPDETVLETCWRSRHHFVWRSARKRPPS